MTHVSVLVEETLAALDLKMGDTVVDGTLGLGGHAARMLEAVGPAGKLLGFDWDEAMLSPTTLKLQGQYGSAVSTFHADYREIPKTLRELNVRPNGILLDLGLNNAQIEDGSRGISFKTNTPLDMRMNRSAGEPASALLNRLAPSEIENILWNYADERWAKKIARQICDQRKSAPLRTTQDLVDAVLAAVPAGARDTRIHPATRTFQAVRIAVNKELEDLQSAFEEIAETLAVNGTLVVLEYHSGEGRESKMAFRSLAADGRFIELYKKPIQPSSAEVARNPKSRSGKLRALRRIQI